MALSILFNMINVAGQQRNGTVSVGEIVQSGWSAHEKQNIGQGMLFGVNNSLGIITNIMDNDLIDSPIVDDDGTITNQGQSL
ncbi:hypothetical protein [Paenibacillus aestuarii]|uniref:Spore germination protein n=1 Tax=Paenibacillus aestuarii TaxID=516965 RepID=A0ABW0KCC6_9BACL|nr:hypothetical protein [Paenibacillus aestuarii]